MTDLRFLTLFACVFSLFAPQLMAIPAATANTEVADLYEEALIEFNQGEISTSVIHLKNVLRADPSFLAGHILLGRSYLQQGYAALAEKELRLALDYGADRALVIEYLAEAYLLQLRFEPLLDDIHTGNYAPAVNAKILVARGQALAQLGKLDEALLEFRDAAQLDVGNIDALLGQARVLLRQGDFTGSERMINLASDLQPANATVWYTRGALAHAQTDFDSSLEYYSKALEHQPDHYHAKLARAGVYMDRGNFVEAESELQTLYAQAPEDPQVAYLLATSLRKNGKQEAASSAMHDAKLHLAALSEAVVVAHGPTLFLAGLIHFDLGEYQKAKVYLSSYISRHFRETRARVLLGNIYLQEGAVTKAVSTLEPVLKYAPDDYQALMMLADAYMRMNKFFKASQLFDRAAGLAPDDPAVLTGMGVNDLMRGQKSEGLSGLESALGLQQRAGSAGFVLVTTLLKDGDVDKAVDVARRLQEKSPDNPIFSNLLATALVEQGDIAAARQIYTQLTELHPDFYPAKINRIKLDVLSGELDAGEQALQAMLEQQPENITLMVEMARLQLGRRNMEAAIQWLEKAHALDAGSILAAARLVDLYLHTGQNAKALAVAEKVYDKQPDDMRTLVMLGEAEVAVGDRMKARVTLKNASQEGGFRAESLPRIAELQLQAEDLNGALYTLEKYVNAHPQALRAKQRLVELQIASGRYEKAADGIALLREAGLMHAAARLSGDSLLAQDSPAAALVEYEKALQARPSTAAAMKVFRTHLQMGKENVAMDFVKNWVAEYPQDYAMREILAEGYLQTGRYAEAQQTFEALLDGGYRPPMIYNNLAMIYVKNDDDRAEDYARRAYEVLPERASVLDTLGWVLVQKGQLAEGLSLLREAHARAADDNEIRYHIGAALLRMGRKKEALIEFEQVVGSQQRFDGYAEAERLLQTLVVENN